MAERLPDGTPVKVTIQDRSKWTDGAAAALDGLVGVVREFTPTGSQRGGAYLVEFSKRPKPWHSNQIPSHAWWFEREDLTPCSAAPTSGGNDR